MQPGSWSSDLDLLEASAAVGHCFLSTWTLKAAGREAEASSSSCLESLEVDEEFVLLLVSENRKSLRPVAESMTFTLKKYVTVGAR